MRVTIYQPQYFPRLHYLHRILHADIFVILDTAQYTKTLVHKEDDKRERNKSYQSDTPIKSPSGTFLLTVPLKGKQGFLPINQTQISYNDTWQAKHITTIKTWYRKTHYLETVLPKIQDLIHKEYDTLALLNINTILWGIVALCGSTDKSPEDITVKNTNRSLAQANNVRLKKVALASEMGIIRPAGLQKGTEWTAAICKKLNATEYYHGKTAQNAYMEMDYYLKRGIKPVMQQWQCTPYKQLFMDKTGFLPNLSIIDLLCNVDREQARKIMNLT